jgi:tripartite-type tricarboxylate transporter receptor subunit TctC
MAVGCLFKVEPSETEMKLCKRELAALALASSVLPMGAVASDTAASYPQGPITLVIGYPPGGGTDALARLLAKYMEDELGQKMIVDYRPGAASNIGAQAVARAAPDGYTVYLGGRPNTIHRSMYGHIKYDFSRDLVPIGLVATMPYVIAVGKDAPIATVQDLIALAKAYPGALTCASPGTGTSDHLLCELLQQETGIDMVHVPYRGSAPALADVMAGRVDMQIASLPSAIPHIAGGNLRGIAVMSRTRVAAASDIPTIGESGLADLNMESWYGLVAPAGTPPQVVARLNRSINAVLTRQDLQEALTRLAYVTPQQPNTPKALEDLIAEETARWTAVLEQRNIKPLH